MYILPVYKQANNYHDFTGFFSSVFSPYHTVIGVSLKAQKN